MAKCDRPSCGAEIVWAETPEGKRQPFDREPNPELAARSALRMGLNALAPSPRRWAHRVLEPDRTLPAATTPAVSMAALVLTT